MTSWKVEFLAALLWLCGYAYFIYIYSIIVIYILFTPRIIIQSETTKLEKRVPTLHASGRGWIVYLNRPFRVSWNQMILGQRWTRPVVHEANECLKKNHKLSIPTLRPRYSLVRHGSASFSKAKAKKKNNPQDTVSILDKYLVVPPKPPTVPDIWEFSHQEIQINPAIFHDPGHRRPARWSKKLVCRIRSPQISWWTIPTKWRFSGYTPFSDTPK